MGEEGSECVRAGAGDEGVEGRAEVRGVSAATAVSARAGEMLSMDEK